ncbi:hypothetical protein PENTCL1PPCAC_25737 [Pristionchus entomophagus]|uniref:Uncharacterized protein n=1 Tax=Pristionchus entomophagus TaxID=358040 RepID=A0AAV5UB27_9BILA|nr:hypothetical protein PENTCL1PPCAC_25737 [Pristionchus entomophagus]
MNLRVVCKVLHAIVAESDYTPRLPYQHIPGSLVIQQFHSYDRSVCEYNWKTSIAGLISSPVEDNAVSETNYGAYTHLLSRLYRRAHYKNIDLRNITFARDVPTGRMNGERLLRLTDSIGCDTLNIRVNSLDYDPRMFDFISKFNPRKKLEVYILCDTVGMNSNPIVIDEKYISDLPNVVDFTISAQSSVLQVSDTTIIKLITKHRSVWLNFGPIDIQPQTFQETAKIVAKHDHFFTLVIHLDQLIECLRSLNVGWNGHRLISLDPSVMVIFTPQRTTMDIVDYAIDVIGSRITINIDDRLRNFFTVRIEKSPIQV